ncbi:MAG TPA: YciI family protein [Pseudolabrys sp.]|nr:YciI family protein [Pseudolabrys sp.]
MPIISNDMPHFFVKLIAPRPTFANDMNDQEKAIMQEHFLYWKARQDKGEVLVFGPVLDPNGPYGMGVINVTDDIAARAFSADDPTIKANIGFTCEIYPMRAVTREQTN